LIILPPKATAHDAARAMAQHRVGTVLVGEGREIVGIVTDRDLSLAIVGGDLDPRATTLRSVMSEPVASVDVDASVAEVTRIMRERGCRRVPVTEDGIPVGLVTLDDLLHAEEISPSEARRLMISQFDSLMPEADLPPQSNDARARTEQRHRARADRTFLRLLRAVERNTGITDHARAERAIMVIMGAVCRRLTPQEARHFLAQLPSKLHDRLAHCLSGPDRQVTTQSIEVELVRELELMPAAAGELLFAVCEVVADSISAGEIEAVRGQLPAGMKELFPLISYRRTA
jgi:uncharacterized protein (DUF2267 family)